MTYKPSTKWISQGTAGSAADAATEGGDGLGPLVATGVSAAQSSQRPTTVGGGSGGSSRIRRPRIDDTAPTAESNQGTTSLEKLVVQSTNPFYMDDAGLVPDKKPVPPVGLPEVGEPRFVETLLTEFTK